ncbi:MAG: hypothetical protein E7559_07130, partial [Ruminococcaceae bacterium]|nr:hypothetical protein [Oscillospiraceae bacterium]
MSLESKPIPAAELRSAVESSKAYARLIALFDEGSMTEFDPLSVSEGKPAEVVAAFGLVNGINTCAFAQNSAIAGGAISKASAAKIARVFDYALKVGTPIVGIYDSTGARLKQGNEMLAAIGDLLNRSGRHVVIFLYYTDASKTQMVIIEQGGGAWDTNTVSC